MKATHLLVPVALLAVSVPAQAAPAVTLAYDAPAGCPSESEFVAAVTARGADFDAARATPVAQVMVVSISRAQDGFAGAFQVRGDGEATNKRRVRGASCREVADALAVVTAIALQGGAGGDSGEAPAALASPPPGAADSQPSSSSASAPAAAPPPPSSVRLRAHTQWRPPTSVTVPAGTVRFDMGGSLGAYAGVTVGVVPSLVLPQYEFSVVVAPFVTTPDGAQRIHGIILKLDSGIWGPATYRVGDTRTHVGAVYADWNLCLTPTYDTEGLIVLFCLGAGGGALTFDTSQGMSTAEQFVGFARGVVSGGLQYYLGAGFHVGAELRGGALIGQIAAERADRSTVFSSSPTGTVEVLLGVEFHSRWQK